MRESRSIPVSTMPTGPTFLEEPLRPTAVQLRARRSTRLIVIGVLCACLASLAMAWAWNGAQDSQSVVLMAGDVRRGQLIEASHLTTTNLGRTAGVAVVPAEQAPGLVGQYAQVDLPAGSLPGPGSAGGQAVPAGVSHVGLKLAAGRLPSQPLPAGSRVTLVAVPSAMDNDRSPGAQFDAVVVAAPKATTDGGGWLVDVQVDEHFAATIAALAATERIAVVRRADG